MRKTVLHQEPSRHSETKQAWLDLQQLADVEVTSEAESSPVEAVFNAEAGDGWRASEPGTQTIRLNFAEPQQIRRIHLEFTESSVERTQEFALHCRTQGEGADREILRQRWTFSPRGSTTEIENYRVELDNVRSLQLTIDPDLGTKGSVATLRRWLVA